MQKSMWLTAALLLSLFISGCGGSTTSSSVIASGTTKLTTSDVNNKILYSTSTRGYIAFQTYSGGSAKWDSSENTSSSPALDVSGTWSISSAGELVLTADSTSNASYTFSCLQKETSSGYWLVYDSNSTKKNTRMYFGDLGSTTPSLLAAAYLSKITTTNGVKLGGTIQGTIPVFSDISSNITTITGVAGTSGFVDYSSAGNTGPAQFGTPVGITTMDGKSFFVLDNVNYVVRMLFPDANGIMRVKTLKTLSGTTPVNITFNKSGDITTDGTNLYVADSSNYVIKKLTPLADGTWSVTILAGSSGNAGAIDGTGNTYNSSGTLTTVGTARFGLPIGITTDGTNLYVTDNQAIRKVVISTGEVTTLAGYLGSTGWTDDNVNGTNARFNSPLRITTDGTNLYVADSYNYVIRKVVIATGVVTTLAGSHGNSGTNVASGTSALFNGPNGITTDGKNLYVTDWGPVISGNPATGQIIRKIVIDTKAVTTIAGTNNMIGSDHSHFNCPMGLTMDGTSLYVADSLNYTIRRVK